MPLVIQFHNHDVEGLPYADDFAAGTLCEIRTGQPFVQNHVGSTALVVVGLGRAPRRSYLWELFTIESVVPELHGYRARGHGFVLNPPQLLAGEEFERFCEHCPCEGDFNDVSEFAYAHELVELAQRFHRPRVIDKQTRKFYDELCEAIPDDPDAYVHRARVLEVLGDSVGSFADMQTAAELFAGVGDDSLPPMA